MAHTETLFYTPQEVATKLNVSTATVRRLAQSGALVAKRVGGQWRFPKQKVEAWLEQQDPPAAAEPTASPRRSIMELHGLGAEIWAGIDAQEYVNELRKEWDHRP
jgi:excisionase family DNA binding protein